MSKQSMGTSIRISGMTEISHLTSFVMGEDLQKLQAGEAVMGRVVHQHPFAFIRIEEAELVSGDAPAWLKEQLLASPAFQAEAGEGVLPWLAKPEDGRLTQLFGQEVKKGQGVTLQVTVKNPQKRELALTGVILGREQAAKVKKNTVEREQKKETEKEAITETFKPKLVDQEVKIAGQTLPLHDYQLYALNFIEEHPYCGIFLDIGLGKTLTTLAAFTQLREKGLTGHILVIAPKAIAQSTWQDEIAKWNLPFKTVSFLADEKGHAVSAKKRQEIYEEAAAFAAKSDWHLYFINRELVTKLVDLGPWLFKNVVIDESQSFKSPTAKRFKALKKVRGRIQRLVELTGTPAPNSLEDLWSQIYLLDQGERLGTSISQYRAKYFKPGMLINGHPVDWRPLPGSEEQIYQAIGDLVISMKNTRLELPKLTMVTDTVEMPPKAKNSYLQLKKEQVLEVGGGEITADNAAVLAGRLRQLASGAIYEEDGVNYQEFFADKLERCFYLTSNTSSPCLVAYYFHSDASRLLKYYKKNGVMAELFDGSPQMIKRWNQGEIQVMLVQPASAGAGLNLQAGGHTLIWFTLPWSLEQYQQMNGRLYRQGQKKPVIIHHLLTKGTIDQHVLASLKHKDISQESLLKAVRMSLK